MRNPLDAYQTPEWQVKALLRRTPYGFNGPFYEPCVGDGSIARFLRPFGEVWTNDIDVNCVAQTHLDATMPDTWPDGIRWTVTNPPFNDALSITRNAVCESRIGIVMLLRISWLEPTEERSAFLKEYPPNKIIVMPRWSYKGNGKTDSATTAWMIWTENTVGKSIEIVTKEEMRMLMKGTNEVNC